MIFPRPDTLLQTQMIKIINLQQAILPAQCMLCIGGGAIGMGKGLINGLSRSEVVGRIGVDTSTSRSQGGPELIARA